MARISPKNWKAFQHYKDRAPPWIKLHKELLDDRAFNALPLASKALAPLLWLIASGNKDGWFDGNPEEIAFRLRWPLKDVENGLKPLIASGFFVLEHDASTCLQPATPETEGETEGETESLSDKSDVPAFEAFWKAYPTDKNMSRKAAKAQWNRLSPEKRTAAIAAIPGFKAYCSKNSWYRPKHADGWLSQERFEGYASEPPPDPEKMAEILDRRDKLLRQGKYAETYQ